MKGLATTALTLLMGVVGTAAALEAQATAATRAAATPADSAPSRTQPGARQDTVTFRHDRHAAIECVTCHAAGRRRGGVITETARDCSGCHHTATASAATCATCHQPSEMAAPRVVRATVALSVWDAPRTRELRFEHPRHEKIACAECHAADRSRAFVKTCSSCHTEHHQAQRTCASCHPAALKNHTRALHVTGCATSGCHVRETSAAVTPVRDVCLVCHGEQVRHKPGRECATCHLSQWRPAAAGAPRGGDQR